MAQVLDIGAAIFAFVAAFFWFWSARGELPLKATYWDQDLATDPFYVALRFSAQLNRWAAGFSGLSALCVGAKLLVPS